MDLRGERFASEFGTHVFAMSDCVDEVELG